MHSNLIASSSATREPLACSISTPVSSYFCLATVVCRAEHPQLGLVNQPPPRSSITTDARAKRAVDDKGKRRIASRCATRHSDATAVTKPGTIASAAEATPCCTVYI
eukprot:IDg5088t1